MKRELTAKDSSSIFVVGFFVCQILVVIINLIGIIIGSAMGHDTTAVQLFFNTAVGYLLCTISLDLGMILCFIYSKKHYNMPQTSKPSLKKILIYIGVGAISFLALYPIITCIDTLIVGWGIHYPEIPYRYTLFNYPISLISLVILPAVCEELLFRGVIYTGFSRYGRWVATILSSIMFAIFHMSIYQTVYPILFGMLLGGIMHREGNIIYCIITHAINNFLSLTLSYLNVSLVFNHWTYILLAIILSTTWLAGVIMFIYKKQSNRTPMSRTEITFTISSIIIMLLVWLITLFAS